jgi:ABC-type polysaccharide/polyol phosphate transport system ATPase subunit
MIDLLVESVSKRYRIKNESSGDKDFWAVRQVSFEVRRAESLGIIGHNGAGKSTILKLLSNITAPTEGKITIRGRISALLEVGSGFHPELTGRENIYLSGSILGMRRREIANKLESIVEFAGIQPFIDTPVKRYSSGMYVRLGFAVAAHLNPDILLLDEVLAVGDRAFQEKCKERIAELHRQGMTMIFISHDLTAVRNLCNRALLLQQGRIIGEGSPDTVIRQYTEVASFHQAPQIQGEKRIAQITGIEFYDRAGNRGASLSTAHPFRCLVHYLVHDPIPNGAIAVYFMNTDGGIAAQFTTALNGSKIDMMPGPGTVEFSCTELGLQPGVYSIDICVEQFGTKDTFEWQHGCTAIHVEPGAVVRGVFFMPHTWRRVEK